MMDFEQEYFNEATWLKHGSSYRHYLANAIFRLKKESIKWLDVGCGYGYLVKEAREFSVGGMSIQSFGVDISKYAISKSDAKQWLTRGDTCNLPFKDETFDVVSAFHIVEHLPRPIDALKEYYRVLNVNGLLIMITPSIIGLNKDPTHISEHLPDFWIKNLEDIGFKCQPFYIPAMFSFYNFERPSVNEDKLLWLKKLNPVFNVLRRFPKQMYYLEEPLRILLGHYFCKKMHST